MALVVALLAGTLVTLQTGSTARLEEDSSAIGILLLILLAGIAFIWKL